MKKLFPITDCKTESETKILVDVAHSKMPTMMPWKVKMASHTRGVDNRWTTKVTFGVLGTTPDHKADVWRKQSEEAF